MKIQNKLSFLACCCAVLSSFATGYYWDYPPEGRTHGQDLTDPYLWGDRTPGSVTSLDSDGDFYFRWSFTDPIRTSASVTWGNIYFGQNSSAPFSGTVDLSLTNALGETTGYAEVLSKNIFRVGYNSAHAALTLTAGTLGSIRSPSTDTAIYIGDGSGGGHVTTFDIVGPHAVFQTAYAKRTVIGQGHSSYVTVRDGGLYSGNFFMSCYGGDRCQRESVLRVTGTGSRLEVPSENTGDLVVGSMTGGNTLIVTNGASMTVSCSSSEIKLGAGLNNKSPGTHNRFLVADGSTFTTAGALWVGLNSASNLFEVSGGSTATVAGALYTDKGPYQGIALYGNSIRATGEKTVVNANGGAYSGYFGGHESRLEVTDGATLNIPSDKVLTVGNSYCPACSLVITNGGTVRMQTPTKDVRLIIGGTESPNCAALVDNATLSAAGNHCGIGANSTATNSSLTIRNGANVSLKNIYVGDYAEHGVLTLDGATLTCSSVRFGTSGGTNHVFNLSGAAARLTTGDLYFQKTATWNFTVPATVPDAPLISCNVFKADQPVTLNVCVTESSVQDKVRLLQASGSDISDETMSRLTVNVPSGWKLRRSADKRQLTVSPERGFVLFFK